MPVQDHPHHDHEPGHRHGHGHGHGHAHAHAPRPGHGRAFALGIGLNTAFVAVEAWWGWKLDSLALLADAAHNLGDVAALVLAWAATVASRRPPSARYTYGFKRAGVVAAVVNAVLLLVAMGSLGWEAATRLGSPHPVPGLAVMLIAGLGVLLNGATALLFLRGAGEDLNLRGAFWHMAGDAMVSAGVVVAGGLALWQGWHWLDPVASLLIAVVIVAGSWGLLRDSVHLLFDGVPRGVDMAAVQALLEALPGVRAVHDLHVWAMGTTEVALTAHLVMPGGGADDAFLRDATQRLRAGWGIGHVTLQVVCEPIAAPCGLASASRGDAT